MYKNLHIIMPMAGEGNRFKEKGYDIPKPLISFNKKELYRHALDSIYESNLMSLLPSLVIKHTFIVRKEFITNYNIYEQIKKYYPEANIISVEKTTHGSLETALLAEPYIDLENDAILIMDSDIEFRCQEYYDALVNELWFNQNLMKPLLLSFYSTESKYSYAKCDKEINWWATETIEKNPISTHALTGCYFLGTANQFIKYGKQVLNDFIDNKLNIKECYVSLLYNYYIKYYNGHGGKIRLIDFNIHTDNLWSYGTPEELTHYLTTKKNVWDK